MLELYHDWRSFCSIKVRLCLAEKHLPWESRVVDLMKLEHTLPEYTKLNPNGVVPTLVHDGVPIVESTVINEYLDDVFPDVPLIPADPVARAYMRYWVKFEDDVLHPSIRPPTFNLMMRHELAKLTDTELEERLAKHPNPQRAREYRLIARARTDGDAVDNAKVTICRALDRLEGRLVQSSWLAGTMYSLADVAAAPFIDRLEELHFAALWSDHPAVSDWIARLKSRPAYSVALPAPDQRFVMSTE